MSPTSEGCNVPDGEEGQKGEDARDPDTDEQTHTHRKPVDGDRHGGGDEIAEDVR